jgi:hypothetical protein
VVVLRALAGPVALVALVACGGAAPGAADRTAGGQPRSAASAPSPTAADAPSGEPLDEASARRLIAGRMRAAGLRILEDVTLEVSGVSLVADGFDPVRRVGYEYVAAEERGLELDAAERELLAGLDSVRILVAEPAPAADLERVVEAFLAELPAAPAPPPP